MKKTFLIFLFVFLLFPAISHAAVAFSVNGGSSFSNASNTLSFNLAGIISGTNLIGIVHVGWHGGSTQCSATLPTWAGVNMTSAGAAATSVANFMSQTFWIASPGTGTPTIVITCTGTPGSIWADGITYTGVNQSTPVRAGSYNTAIGVSGTAQVVITSQSGDMTNTTTADGSISSPTTNQTLRNSQNSAAILTSGSDDAAGAATVTHTWTLSAGVSWSVEGFSIAAASATTVRRHGRGNWK